MRMAQISFRLLRLVFSKTDCDCYAHGCLSYLSEIVSQYKEEFSSMKCHLILLHKVKEPLPSDWYIAIQPVVINPASRLEVARALLLLAAEELSCGPLYANEIFNSRGAFPFLMRQTTAVGVGFQKYKRWYIRLPSCIMSIMDRRWKELFVSSHS